MEVGTMSGLFLLEKLEVDTFIRGMKGTDLKMTISMRFAICGVLTYLEGRQGRINGRSCVMRSGMDLAPAGKVKEALFALCCKLKW